MIIIIAIQMAQVQGAWLDDPGSSGMHIFLYTITLESSQPPSKINTELSWDKVDRSLGLATQIPSERTWSMNKTTLPFTYNNNKIIIIII